MAIVSLPRARSSADSSHAHCGGSIRFTMPGVDGHEREAIGLHLEERPALKAGRDPYSPRSRCASAIS